jgi:hypothetical protein
MVEILLNDELERMWKEAVVAYLSKCLKGLKKIAKNTSVPNPKHSAVIQQPSWCQSVSLQSLADRK